MPADDLKDLLHAATERSLRYLKSLDTRPVAPSPEGVAGLSRFDVPLQHEPMDPKAVLAQIDEIGSPATMAMAGPRFFGFVIGGSLPAALAANWFASAWDQNTGLFNSTPSTSMLEQVALKWLLDVLGLPACAGAFVTGTTVAHITALAAARHAVLKKAGWDVEANGLFGAPPITVIASAEAHPTLFKALGVVGLGRSRVIKVPVDAQGRMLARSLPKIGKEPTIVCTQAGNVNTGSFDEVGDICDLARPAGAWVHVDGAFGLWARVAPTRAHFVAGVEKADSWATDCHKWLNVPYDSGVAFVRDKLALRQSMAITAEYLPTETPQRNPSDYTPELSRRARGVDVWAAMRSLGRSGLTEMVERHCRQARRFAEGLEAAGYEILNDVVLNQVLVSFGESDVTRRMIREIQNDGTMWAGETLWQGHTAMRISVIGWSTTDADVEKCLEAIVRIGKRELRAVPANR